jgi:hypothetical protein
MALVHLSIPRPDGTIEKLYEAQPKQELFHLDPRPNVLYGGAAGGGKSHAIRYDALIRCLSVPGYRALLLRRTFPELRDTHIDKLQLEVKRLGGDFLKGENKAVFSNGSAIICGHCEDEASVGRYLSTEYDCIYFDELVTFSEKQYKFIASRARTSKPGVLPLVRAATNPGGSNSYWVKRYWILKDIRKDEDPAYDPSQYGFIPATLDDNEYIDATYEARLMALPSEALRRAFRYGDWDVFEGQYFSEWRTRTDDGRDWHVTNELPSVNGQPLELSGVEIIRAMDWGYRAPGVVGWYACLPDGRLLKFQEFVFREMLARDVAQEIRDRSRGMKVRYTVCDPSIWIKDPVAGESIAETFAKHKVPVIPGDNDRVNGWHRLHSFLRETAQVVTPTGTVDVPMLQFYGPGCPYTVRTIPSLVVDENRIEDVKTKDTEDHAADETRYAVMSRPAPTRFKSTLVEPVNTAFRLSSGAQELLKAQRRKKRPGWLTL